MPAQPRPSKSTPSIKLTLPTGNSTSFPVASSSSLTTSPTPQQYLQRLTDLQQMDLQSAIDQMRTLLTVYPQPVYKMAYYRKQTKNHWARDDPAFSFLQVVMLIAFSVTYGLAFRLGSLSAILGFVLKSVLINWLGFGVVVSSLGRLVANRHLMMDGRSSSHVKQNVEWLYAFDVHCNSFVPLFVILCEYLGWGDDRYITFCQILVFSFLTASLILFIRRSAVLFATNSPWLITAFIGGCKYTVCNSIQLVLLPYSLGI